MNINRNFAPVSFGRAPNLKEATEARRTDENRPNNCKEATKARETDEYRPDNYREAVDARKEAQENDSQGGLFGFIAGLFGG